MDSVDAVHSGIVLYCGGDIVFGAKRSNRRTQWMQYAIRSGIVIYGGGDIVFGAKRSNQWMQWMQGHSGQCPHHHIPLFHSIHCTAYYRSGTVNSKSFVGKVLLRIKRKFKLN